MEELKIYNSISRKKEIFEPVNQGEMRMYVCGVTVYDSMHMGHAIPAIFFDVIRRIFEEFGYKTTSVINFTDVDDKMIARANEQGIKVSDLAETYIKDYFDSVDKLRIKRADLYPKATEYINEMIELNRKLIDNGYAYEAEGDVYFSLTSYKDYGKLTGRSIDDLQSGTRFEVDPRKKDPLDFALWKAEKPGEPSWDSPWGKGRPGWHIECSAMSTKLLGKTFDIHGGGDDLKFPHHENEIAQSEGAFGQTYVKYWMHNGLLKIEGEKMSKSLNNFFSVNEILEKYSPEAIRYFMLRHHYRTPIDMTFAGLDESKQNLERITTFLQRLDETAPTPDGEDFKTLSFEEQFQEALKDDFNTAGAIGVTFDLIRAANSALDAGALNEESTKRIKAFFERFERLFSLLGAADAKDSVDDGLKEKIEGLLVARQEARASKDWAAADRIRDELAAMKVVVKDTAAGPTWTIKADG